MVFAQKHTTKFPIIPIIIQIKWYFNYYWNFQEMITWCKQVFFALFATSNAKKHPPAWQVGVFLNRKCLSNCFLCCICCSFTSNYGASYHFYLYYFLLQEELCPNVAHRLSTPSRLRAESISWLIYTLMDTPCLSAQACTFAFFPLGTRRAMRSTVLASYFFDARAIASFRDIGIPLSWVIVAKIQEICKRNQTALCFLIWLGSFVLCQVISIARESLLSPHLFPDCHLGSDLVSQTNPFIYNISTAPTHMCYNHPRKILPKQ